MEKIFNFLFSFFKIENISVDKTEFLFQMQSHPDFPSLLAISDTLTFFNIENTAVNVDVSEIELLPKIFITTLKEVNAPSQFYSVEKKEDYFLITSSETSSSISRLEFEKKWTGIVLFVTDFNTENVMKTKHNKSYFLLLCLVFVLISLSQLGEDYYSRVFFFFPVIGLLFSMAVLKDLFGVKSQLINNLCNLTVSSSCDEVVNSNKWKIFEYINFTDLSIVFFITQTFSYLFFLFASMQYQFFNIQFLLLLGSFPFILVSLFYQKFIEKKWCPICIILITVLLSEVIFLLNFNTPGFDFSIKSIVFYLAITFFSTFSWGIIKRHLVLLKELKEFQLRANRFQRNYQIFKNTLISKEKKIFLDTPFLFGNKKSKTVITIITHPYCKYCGRAHEILDKLLMKYSENLKLQFVFKVDFENSGEESQSFFRNLMSIYFHKGESEFSKAIHSWYEFKNIEKWIDEEYLKSNDSAKIDILLKEHDEWCRANFINYTPAIFINGYEYPNLYERENLEFFINELIDDPQFNE